MSSERDAETVDPITLSVIRGQINQIVNEMDRVLVSSAFSAIICDANDMATGLYRPSGGTIAQGDLGLPIFVGNMEFLVTHIADRFKGNINEGDIFVTNDPYIGGTHLNDVKLIKPYFSDGRLITFIANTGHWIDIGGANAGGFGISRDIIQDGVRIPAMKLYEAGELNEEAHSIIFENIRNRDEVEGDYKAQLNSIDVGEARLDDLIETYGAETYTKAIEELERRSEDQMRSRLESVPNGRYRYTDYIDNDGIDDKPLVIDLDATVSDHSINLDFGGSSSPCRGPMNIASSCTISACNIAFKHLFPDIPINAGCFKPLSFAIPEESYLNAKSPMSTVGYTETSQRVLDTVMGLLGQAVPEESYGQAFSTSGAIPISGREDGESFTTVYAIAGGYGASVAHDGMAYATPPFGRARMPNVEIMEARNPIRFNTKRLRTDSGGPGRNRGGLGAVYDIEILADEATIGFLGDRGDHTPSGIAGGQSAKGARYSIIRDGTETTPPFRTKASDIDMSAGDRLHVETPGGGGHGPPNEREPERVLEDVQFGYISIEHARTAYNVAIVEENGRFQIDKESTGNLRS